MRYASVMACDRAIASTLSLRSWSHILGSVSRVKMLRGLITTFKHLRGGSRGRDALQLLHLLLKLETRVT